MGVVNTKSAQVTAADNAGSYSTSANPFTSARISGDKVQRKLATVAVASGDDDGSVYRMFRVKSNFVISSLKKFSTALTSGTDWDLGIYETEENGGAAVDADVFADGVSLASADATGTELRFNDSATAGVGTIEKALWELLPGLTEDPNKEYDLCFTANTVGAADGAVSLIMDYQV